MSLRVMGPIEPRCQYCTAWEFGQLPDEHSHVLKLEYDNTCDIVTFCFDGKVLFVIDLSEWEVLHKHMQAIIGHNEPTGTNP